MPNDAERIGNSQTNAAPLHRWLLLAAASYMAAVCCGALAENIILRLSLLYGEWRGTAIILINLLPMEGGIFVFALLIRRMCRMELRDFILGTGHEGGIRSFGIVLCLYLAGYALSELPHALSGEIVLNSLKTAQILVNALVCLILVPLQSAGEEFVFRGIFLRSACGSELRCTKRAAEYGVISSVIFMLMHSGTPALSSQKELLPLIMTYSVYLLQGGLMYAMDLHFGDLMPGVIWHWINNLLAYWFLSAENGMLSGGTILLRRQNEAAGGQLGTTLLLMLPMLIYLLADLIHRK